MLLSHGHARMAQYHARDFGWNAQTEEHSSETATERMPAVPAVSDDRPDYATAEVVEMKRASHLLPRENPFSGAVLALMRVENFPQRFDNGKLLLRLIRLGVAHVGAPHGPLHIEKLAVVIRPLQSSEF